MADLMTVTEAAQLLGVTDRAVPYRAAEMGARKFGKTYLLTAEQVEAIRAALTDPRKLGRKPTRQVGGDARRKPKR